MKTIQTALISVFYKDGLLPLAQTLQQFNVTIYSTGGTLQFLKENNISCVAVEDVTSYPSILGGRVKTLHPKIFGGILGRRNNEQDIQEMAAFDIATIDLVMVDLYPFEETLTQTTDENLIIEKIDIGGPSMLRAAAKNFKDVAVIASKKSYTDVNDLLQKQNGCLTIEQRKALAAKAFEVVKEYDIAINNYFNPDLATPLRYGENPHQQAVFTGNLYEVFSQLHGKELSYNNLVDVDAAVQLVKDFSSQFNNSDTAFFAIIKHTNVCGAAIENSSINAWKKALAGDPESAFGGILICNQTIDVTTAQAISEIFFEVLIAPNFSDDALAILTTKKNRILLQLQPNFNLPSAQQKTILNGVLKQANNEKNIEQWNEVGGRVFITTEKQDALLANLLCKHLKSNAIALVKDGQLIGKGCGQTSRIDALRHALEKTKQFNFDTEGSVLASDAFFPFSDCVEIAHKNGISCFIQPGGSIRDKDSIDYCVTNNLAMVLTGVRHFKH